MSNELPVKNCNVCGSIIKCEETGYVWFRRFVKVIWCNSSPCKTRAFCLICKNYIIVDDYFPFITYFIHILSHYGLNADYIHDINPITYTINDVYTNIQNAYSYVPQLLFVSVEGLTKHRYLELTDIQYRVKYFALSCLICDNFYETFPTLEVVVSHLMKVHIDSSGEPVELPPLIDFIRNVNFK